MAKKKIDPTEYIKSLPGLDDATRQLLAEKIGSSPDALKQFQDDLMRTSEYQSHMSELEKDRQAATEAQKKADDLKSANEQWYRENVGSGMLDQIRQEKAQSEALLAAYRQTYGDIAGVPPAGSPLLSGQQPNPGYVTKKDLDEFASRITAQNQDWSAGMVSKANKLSFNHYKQFGEPLDIEQVIQEAIKVSKEPVAPLDIAYQRLTADKQQAANEAAQKARDEQNRKDWERDYRSRQNNPMEARPEDHSIIYQAIRQPQDKPMVDHNMELSESNRMESFRDIWRTAGEELDAKESGKVA